MGRGLDALLSEIESFESLENKDEKAIKKDYFFCDLEIIQPNRYQPRLTFSEEELAELSHSIREQGMLQPLIVRTAEDGYELIAGERRLRAARMAGLNKAPVVIREVSDSDMLQLSIVENIHREDLNPMEVAEAYHRLMTEFDLTQEKAAERVGKSRSAVANFLRLRQLPEPVKDSILKNRISMGHARALLGVESSSIQLEAWKTVISKGLSVRETEKLVKRLKNASTDAPSPPPTAESLHIRDLSDRLSKHLGTRVQISKKGKKGKGRLEIEFYSDEDLDRLLNILAPEKVLSGE